MRKMHKCVVHISRLCTVCIGIVRLYCTVCITNVIFFFLRAHASESRFIETKTFCSFFFCQYFKRLPRRNDARFSHAHRGQLLHAYLTQMRIHNNTLHRIIYIYCIISLLLLNIIHNIFVCKLHIASVEINRLSVTNR